MMMTLRFIIQEIKLLGITFKFLQQIDQCINHFEYEVNNGLNLE